MQTSTARQIGYAPVGAGNPTYPMISQAELEEKSMSVDESEALLSQQIHDFFHPKA